MKDVMALQLTLTLNIFVVLVASLTYIFTCKL